VLYDADYHTRRDYEERAARSEPGLEAGAPPAPAPSAAAPSGSDGEASGNGAAADEAAEAPAA